MDRRINYLMGLDTETCNGILVNDKLDLSQSIVYDIGWVITDKKGRIYETRSFLIYEVFVMMKDVMASAYYADKIPMYWEQVKNGQRKLVKFSTMYNQFWEDVKKYSVKNAFAHNARFDVNAMARQTIGKQKSYRKYCEINNFVTKHKVPQPRLTAEILYRYITGDVTFEESHTGLEDVLIETKIMVHCFRQHKKMEKRLFTKVA